MKKCVLLIILIAIGAGCHIGHHNVSGSGNRKTEKRNVGSFSSISTEGAFDIEVVCQKPQDIEIKGDDNILPLVSTEISNNVLHIKSLRGYSVAEPITLKISVPDLEGISSAGAGTIEVTGIKNEKLTINANGAPTIRASGETKTLKIDAVGAGKLDTHKLRAARVEVEAKGVASVEVYAREQLDVNISGPSHVIYQGDAAVHKSVIGPGSVEKKESEVD
ncbi:MAG TPA: head GIN domain-containing protein [Pyrinomonadaceae bacterium]|nr:head GIN domain-containing protein [Pyrinomonadaceae bacterium]